MPSKKTLVCSVALVIIVCAIAYTCNAYIKNYTSVFDDRTLYSTFLGEQRKVFIRLPKNYDANKAYPLIIKTDGNFNIMKWDSTLTEFAAQGISSESIMVAIPNQFWEDTRNRDLVPPYARKDVNINARPVTQTAPEIFGKADLFLAFIEKELLPYLEANYKLNNNRILTGFSAGGSFVLYTLNTNPDLFTGYFVFSPAAWYDDSIVVDEFSKSISKPIGQAKYIYLSLGAQENDIITGSFKGLLNALEHKASQDITWGHSYAKDAGHNENPAISVPKAIKSYYEFRAKQLNLID